MLDEILLRPIEERDNTAIAAIIRSALAEFGANKPGTVYYDETTDRLSEVFTAPRSFYLVAERDHELLGGGGIFPSPGLDSDTCELVKMYLRKDARGVGLGRKLIEKSLAWAKEAGYKQVYLETMPELKQALKTYERFGFHYINGPMGNTGHYGCDRWMLKKF